MSGLWPPLVSERSLRFAIGALALVGIGITGYLTYTRYAGAEVFCSTGGCETVQSSPYAEVLGMPVAVIGLAGYLAILAAALGHGEFARVGGASLALAAAGFGSYLLYVQLALIGAVCQWCVASDAVTSAIAVLSLARLTPYLRAREVGAHA